MNCPDNALCLFRCCLQVFFGERKKNCMKSTFKSNIMYMFPSAVKYSRTIVIGGVEF